MTRKERLDTLRTALASLDGGGEPLPWCGVVGCEDCPTDCTLQHCDAPAEEPHGYCAGHAVEAERLVDESEAAWRESHDPMCDESDRKE